MAKVRKRTWIAANGETRTAWAVDFTDSNGARQRKQFRSKRAADDFRVEIEESSGPARSGPTPTASRSKKLPSRISNTSRAVASGMSDSRSITCGS